MPDTIVLRHGETEYRVELAGNTVRLDGGGTLSPAPKAVAVAVGETRWVFLDGETYEFHVQRSGRRRATGHAGSLSAPMPATVLRLNVAPGDRVSRGDTLIVLEAMKMELPVRAPSDAVIGTVYCREGELVQPGVSLIDLQE